MSQMPMAVGTRRPQIWRGDLSWSRAMLNGNVTIHGAADVRRAVPGWLGQSLAAAVPRPA